MERLAATPFGPAGASRQGLARQANARARQDAIRNGDGGNSTGTADKWQILRALTEARQRYALSDRTICVLEALLSFTKERTLDGRDPIIVFPSNRELSFRARGMAPATIRRHIAALVDAGMIFRRDSPNGKRYCRRDDAGLVESAFGFDLAPLALRADEIYSVAESERARVKAMRALRGEYTILARDITKIINLAMEEGVAGDWESFILRKQEHATATGSDFDEALNTKVQSLRKLLAEVETAYLSSLSDDYMSANDKLDEQHYHNSKTELTFESNGDEDQNEAPQTPPNNAGGDVAIGVAKLVTLCPQLTDYAGGEILGWYDVLHAANVIRSVLGVSSDAWLKAQKAMGEKSAAVAVAIILERAESIRSAGGYLRSLTDQAERRQFSIYAMIQAWEKSRKAASGAVVDGE